jgi:hypothetical protein
MSSPPRCLERWEGSPERIKSPPSEEVGELDGTQTSVLSSIDIGFYVVPDHHHFVLVETYIVERQVEERARRFADDVCPDIGSVYIRSASAGTRCTGSPKAIVFPRRFARGAPRSGRRGPSISLRQIDRPRPVPAACRSPARTR